MCLRVCDRSVQPLIQLLRYVRPDQMFVCVFESRFVCQVTGHVRRPQQRVKCTGCVRFSGYRYDLVAAHMAVEAG